VDYEPDDAGSLEVSAQDEELLREVRDRYEYGVQAWQDIRRERNIDLRYVCGDPWSSEDRAARENPKDPAAKRPCLNHDELNQYINQSLNNVRQNKRGIRVEPAGEGADDQTAEYRQNRIRAIEYRSKATQTYETAYQHMIEGSYGFWRINREYVSDDPKNWNQEIVIKPIPNPDSVIYDPDCKEPDWSDARWAFVVETVPKDEFKRRYPGARATDFVGYDDKRINDTWVNDQTVLLAEYWRVDIDVQEVKRKVDGKTYRRKILQKSVTQYITNGVEILESNDQPGDEIPIPCCIGLERYINDGTTTSRRIFSLVRLARDPQMSLAYLVSLEAECAGLLPKNPYIVYVGQIETDREAWKTATKVPHPFLQIDPIPDSANGQILPKPTREPMGVDFGSFEVAKESARRAIQAAMGVAPLPTAAMRANEKSGIAIQKIQQEMALGSYHFVDNFERALERCGRIIESWLPGVDCRERDVPLCTEDDKRKVVRISAPLDEAEHDVTISVGPSNQSQRQAADDFLQKSLVPNLPNLPLAPPQAAQLLALSIKGLQLGPMGDQMAEIIWPEEQQQQQLPPQVQAMLQQQGQQLQQLHAYAAQLEQEKNAKVVENQARIQIEQLKANADIAVERLKLETQLAVASIQTKSQETQERTQLVSDVYKHVHSQAHELGMQAHSHAFEKEMQDAEHAHERDLADQQAQAAQAQAAQQPEQPEGQ
jgi:hypothetical protein